MGRLGVNTSAPKRIWDVGSMWAEVRSGLSMFRERLVQAFDAGNYEVESARLDDVARRITERIEPMLAEHARIVAEKDAEIARMREALVDATAHLVGAESAYRTYARRYTGITPKAEVDPFFSTRVEDFARATDRARAALGESHD